MSIAAQTASALARAVFIGGAAVAISGWLAHSLGGLRGRARNVAWALLLAPFLTPSLLISYAFSRIALALIVSPWSHQALYAAVLLLKLVPVATLIRWLLPPPLSAEARHCHRTLTAPSLFKNMMFRFRGAGSGPWFACGIVFLLAFADFELASLWSVKTWTVAIFDAQAGGLNLRESLRLAAWPLGTQLAALVLLALRGGRIPSPANAGATKCSRAIFGYLAPVAFIVCALPLLIVTAQAATGFRAVLENFVLGNEIASSVLFALVAAVIAGVRFRGAHSSRVLVSASRRNELPSTLERRRDSLASRCVQKVREGGTPSPALGTSALPGISPRRRNPSAAHSHERLLLPPPFPPRERLRSRLARAHAPASRISTGLRKLSHSPRRRCRTGCRRETSARHTSRASASDRRGPSATARRSSAARSSPSPSAESAAALGASRTCGVRGRVSPARRAGHPREEDA